ncbi:MAG: hypothetical protein M3Y87_36140 [Myxococcota bacterium]|nr:hypothetical protein [Myxococcota bacterium]
MSPTSYTLPPAPHGIAAQLGPGRPMTTGYRDGGTREPPLLVITFARSKVRELVNVVAAVALCAWPLLLDCDLRVGCYLAAPFVLLAYVALARLVNRIRLVAQRELKVSHGPLPWIGAGPFRLEDIEAFSVRSARIRRVRYCRLVARVKGRDETLIRVIFDDVQAHYLADALRAWLETARR